MTRALGDHMLKMPARAPIRYKVWMPEPDFGVSFRVLIDLVLPSQASLLVV